MNFLVKEIAKPAVRRLFTALGTYLASTGVADGTIDLITAGGIAASGLLIDLALSAGRRS